MDIKFNEEDERQKNEAEIMKAINILNFYRNTNYNQPSGTKEYELAQTINVILPEYNKTKTELNELKHKKELIIEEFEEVIEMLQSDRTISGKYSLSSSTKRYSKGIEEDLQEIIDKYKPNSKTKYTNHELINLRICYESPTNEFRHLSFEEYIKNAEDENLIEELLED